MSFPGVMPAWRTKTRPTKSVVEPGCVTPITFPFQVGEAFEVRLAVERKDGAVEHAEHEDNVVPGETRFDQLAAGIADIEAAGDQRLRRRRRENVLQFEIDAV